MTSLLTQPDKPAPMPQRPSFSVLVPTYNQAPYLGAALDSLLAQTCPDWEAVVVNDGSTDFTAQVLDDYAQKDERFRVFHKENGGPGSALNVGLEHARGEWICWLSSDDLFDPRKLEIHRDWITKYPEDRFFFTHFKEFNEVTGELTDPPLWHPAPEREYQVVEMLHHTYVHGNSICVNRNLWSQAGSFDTSLRYGQDYDMWLRLVALSPARFIPDRTCVTRVNPLQMSHGFPEAPFYDCAKAGINFVNERTLAQLFPAVDLSDPKVARKALLKALEVAQNPYSFIYHLGVHPLLLLRIMHWVFAGRLPEPYDASFRQLIHQRALEASRLYQGTALGFLWKIAAIASRLGTESGGKLLSLIGDETLPTAAITEAEYWRQRSTGRREATALRRYLEKFEGTTLKAENGTPEGHSGDVIFICHSDKQENDTSLCDLTNELIQAAKSLMKRGRCVAVIRLGEYGMGVVDGVFILGAPNANSLGRALKAVGPLDTVIECPGENIISKFSARRSLVYRPQSRASAGRSEKPPAVSEAQSPDVDIVISNPANWSDVIESFAPRSGKEAAAYLRRRITQVKRKVRKLTTQ